MGNVAQQIAQQWADQGALIANGDTAELGHVHQQTDVTDLTTELANKLDSGEVGVSVAPLVSGVVPLANIPSIPLGITHEVADQAAMLALDADVGDFAIIAGVATYRLKALPADTLGNWVELPVTPGVTSVQGLTGAVLLPVATPSIDGLMSAADKSMIAANTANIATNTSAISTNTNNIATKITDPGGATEGQVLSYIGGTLIWAGAAGADVLWSVVDSSPYTASAGQRLAITSTNPVTLTLPVSGTEGDAIEIENIGKTIITLNAIVNGQSGQLITAEIKASRIVWAGGGWRCRDSDSPYNYNLTGGFTDGAAITTTDEILYAIGTNLGTQSWVNPHTAGRVAIVRSSIFYGTNEQVCDRQSQPNQTDNRENSWYSCDFGADGTGRQILPSKFRFQHGRDSGLYRCLSLIVEGSNDAASNSVADLSAATWSPIATSSSLGLAAVAHSWSTEIQLPGSTWYRWLRIRMTAANSYGQYQLMISEIAFGGQIRFT